LHENFQDFLQNFLKGPDKLRKPKRENQSWRSCENSEVRK